MPKRRNEVESMIRQEPFSYRAAFDANNNVEYEGWAQPSTAEGTAAWIVAKHTYDANQNLTKTEWASKALFDQIWTNYSSLVYT